MDLGTLTLFLAGLGTFFTPCVLPLIPIYLAILLGAKSGEERKGASIAPALAFIVGFSLVFTLMGLGASSLGALLVKHKMLFSLIAGLLILVFGLKFLGVIRIGLLERDTRYQGDFKKSRFMTLNAFFMGFFFAFGWTPCVGPILGSVLSWTAISANSPIQGALYLSIFSAGFAVPMLLAAVFTTQTQALFNKIKPRMPVIEKALGAIMVLVALSILAPVMSSLMAPDTLPRTAPPIAQQSATSNTTPGKPTMIEFFSPNCGACRAVSPTVDAIIRTCQGKNIDFDLIDLSDTQNHAKAKRYSIRAIPTFVFLDENGQEVARLLGVQTERTFLNHLAALTGQPCPDINPVPKLPYAQY